MLIGLTGYARSGKDTVGKILVDEHGFTRLAFADYLKEVALAIDPLVSVARSHTDSDGAHLTEVVEELGWEKAKENPEVRRFLQRLGAEGIRDHVGEDFWINYVMAQALPLMAQGKHIVVTDVRFPNEAKRIRNAGGEIWRIERAGVTGTGHSSEALIDSLPYDATIVNATLDSLPHQVSDLLEGSPRWQGK